MPFWTLFLWTIWYCVVPGNYSKLLSLLPLLFLRVGIIAPCLVVAVPAVDVLGRFGLDDFGFVLAHAAGTSGRYRRLPGRLLPLFALPTTFDFSWGPLSILQLLMATDGWWNAPYFLLPCGAVMTSLFIVVLVWLVCVAEPDLCCPTEWCILCIKEPMLTRVPETLLCPWLCCFFRFFMKCVWIYFLWAVQVKNSFGGAFKSC